ncbi:hypothetical protein [Cryobacterium luteum]|uniref:CobQ/CobB/MinD/ParA nucleotide binding domain-containing protein n=1 Tax=Cryobacterium luteum TaxID=1424661 RepID=A0A1H8A8T4_9MICO|nr:hypothetical protein [Cryobacterium luteum]TFB88410.1 hypothetical protein E3O10_11370 [Cryobacterium luteum]SEM66199.1 hypothetical protein SAMN05216281_10152 [Cryobacterium luteum]
MTVRIVLAGTAGGVGTTTLTALLFDRVSTSGGVATLADHTSGDLGARLARGDGSALVDPTVLLHDLGAHAEGEGLDLLESPSGLGIVVTANTPIGLAAAHRVLQAVRARYSEAGLARTTVVAISNGRRPGTAGLLDALWSEFGREILVVLGHDPALAGGGPIAAHRLDWRTVTVRDQIVRRLRTLPGGL